MALFFAPPFQSKIGFNKGLIFATNFQAQIFEMSFAVV
jgi:hypothetical protein